MRSIPLRTALARGALVVPLVVAVGVAAPANAGQRGANHPQLGTEYQITELASLGGTSSAGNSINNRGWVGGTSREPVDNAMRATLWRHGLPTNLGTLGGPHSAILWPAKNNRGIVVGVTETPDIDRHGEQWSCAVFFGEVTENACVGFVWERGEMRPLPTFGGTHGFATGANNRGQVVGWAETADRDPTCVGRDQVLEFIGALWDTRDGDRVHKLLPLPGDSASTGNAINDRGQVVGISGDCDQAVGRFSARHMALWENGKPTEIESFGAEAWNTPMALNNRGVVVGFANAAGTEGGTFNGRPFSWTRWDGIDDLGVLDGDAQGQALGINNEDQIVGLSRGDDGDTAVIWQHGTITDLNLVAGGYPGHLRYAGDINDDGVITGQAISVTGEAVTFMAAPVRSCDLRDG